MRNKKNSEGFTLMEWACAAGAYAAWLAGEDPTDWRNARSSDESVMAKSRASLERLVGGPLEEDVKECQEPPGPQSTTPTEVGLNPIPKFGEVWISKDRRRANYFTVRSVNLKDGEVHTSDHRTIKLSRMGRYRKLK